MKFWKENAWWIILFSVIAIVLVGTITWIVVEAIQYENWYDSLTPSEKAEVDLQRQQAYESRIHRYEIVSIHKYTKDVTNNFGGVIKTKVCYSFTYLDGDKLCSKDNFQHLEYGLTKVTIGNENLYIVNDNGETTYTLQLTKETLANIKGLN